MNETERNYGIEGRIDSDGQGPDHFHFVPASADGKYDVFRYCQASHCALRPVYRSPDRALEETETESYAGPDYQTWKARERAHRPLPITEIEWADLLACWDAYDDTPTARAANRSILQAAADEEKRQRQLAVAAATEAWFCPRHGAGAMVIVHGLHGHYSRRCGVCGASFPWSYVEPWSVAPTGWACPEHGLAAIRMHQASDGRVYGMCRLCREYEGRR